MADTPAPGILAGKRGLIMGVANNRSIAWGIEGGLGSQDSVRVPQAVQR